MSPAWHHNIGVQILADVDVTFHVALERSDVDSAGRRPEPHFRVTEGSDANNEDVAVWELISLRAGTIVPGKGSVVAPTELKDVESTG